MNIRLLVGMSKLLEWDNGYVMRGLLMDLDVIDEVFFIVFNVCWGLIVLGAIQCQLM